MISYKYNIYHSKKTKYLDKMLRECCFVWNHALALQRQRKDPTIEEGDCLNYNKRIVK